MSDDYCPACRVSLGMADSHEACVAGPLAEVQRLTEQRDTARAAVRNLLVEAESLERRGELALVEVERLRESNNALEERVLELEVLLAGAQEEAAQLDEEWHLTEERVVSRLRRAVAREEGALLDASEELAWLVAPLVEQ